MSSLAFALVAEAAIVLLVSLAYVALIDRADARRRSRPAPIMLAPLPVARLHVATAWRRRSR